MIEQHNPEILDQARHDQAPHTLVTPETVGSMTTGPSSRPVISTLFLPPTRTSPIQASFHLPDTASHECYGCQDHGQEIPLNNRSGWTRHCRLSGVAELVRVAESELSGVRPTPGHLIWVDGRHQVLMLGSIAVP